MNWVELSVHTSREAVEAVSNLLQELGADGVAIEDPEVLERQWETSYGEVIELSKADYPEQGVKIKAYLPEFELTDVDTLLKQVRSRVQQLNEFGIHPGPATVEAKTVNEESWASEWKNYYKPVRVSERLTVKPIWEEYVPESDWEKVIELDPGMAFGTGTHPTTVLSMRLLEKYLTPGMRVIDVGSGSGILSITAAKLGAESVLALDLDPLAVKNTEKNVKLNNMQGVVTAREGDLLRGVSDTAECVVANILAEIILLFVFELPRVLVPGGIFIASGIIEEKADQVIQSLQEFGLEVLETIHHEGWVAIAAKKW
ncbi:50S ribosomal protein L11 methyltransferase [Paenactinomyces guangxiensis]|uniref:Ribosomal protein L11 methyltransferase n=1 Tax=Paenactinomyces guangxiensis TaxID=1490290 RepID=A0A7W1WNG5_9BACL|nr:50S ribosomal protein L11 methyltransferase [Paenactinomyces guangxiensis]MBA4493131.1 50S ribosomal protein L11 methyltransferase [Paenactinomyces guangxiensis]MBH8590019.1 50S ribosomal protein L11 methyltransferase [Paenactinomyces guangxiensis]